MNFRPLLLALALAGLTAETAAAYEGELVTRQDASLGGLPADGDGAGVADISDDGRLVLIQSKAPNFTREDEDTIYPGIYTHVFLRDRATGSTALISPFGRISWSADIAADGGTAVYLSVPEAHVLSEVRVRDLRTGAEEIVARGSSTYGYAYPQAAPKLSADGRVVAFADQTSGGQRLVVLDRRTGRRSVFGPPRSSVRDIAVSGDGKTVAWQTAEGGGRGGVYVHDRRRRRTVRVHRFRAICCLINGGRYDVSLSSNGRRLAYVASRRNGREREDEQPVAYLRDVGWRRSRIVSRDRGRTVYADGAQLSGDGRRLHFVALGRDVSIVRNLRTGRTLLRDPDGIGIGMSSNGRWLSSVADVNGVPQGFVRPLP